MKYLRDRIYSSGNNKEDEFITDFCEKILDIPYESIAFIEYNVIYNVCTSQA